MTREEAIQELEILKENYWDDDGYGHKTKQYDDTILALEMAIKALEQEPILDRVKEDFIARYPRNYANELELGGRSCIFSLNDILQTIDRYKAESEE